MELIEDGVKIALVECERVYATAKSLVIQMLWLHCHCRELELRELAKAELEKVS